MVLLLPVLLTACAKNPGPRTVEGRVLNAVTQQPLPNAQVALYRQRGTVQTREEQFQVQADQEGNYKLSFTPNEDYLYYLSATAPGYWQSSYAFVQEQKKNTLDLQLNQQAKLQVFFVSRPPDYDYSIYKFQDPVSGVWDYAFAMSGTKSFLVNAKGGQQNTFRYILEEFDTLVQQELSASVFCPPGITTSYYIYY